jgi:hypothetical protein
VELTALGEPDLQLPADARVLEVRADGSPVSRAAAGAFLASLPELQGLRAVSPGEPPGAVVSFEGFAPDQRLALAPIDQGSDESFLARRTAAVRGTIELSRPGGEVLDRLSDVGVVDVWEAEGPSTEAAETSLPTLDQLAAELGASVGAAYARRVAPSWTRARRTWFTAGERRIRAGALRARLGDWEAARAPWSSLAEDPTAPARARARALHDLALAYELDGEVGRAWSTVRAAAALAPVRRIEEYREALESARSRHRLLLERIALPGEAPSGGEDG